MGPKYGRPSCSACPPLDILLGCRHSVEPKIWLPCTVERDMVPFDTATVCALCIFLQLYETGQHAPTQNTDSPTSHQQQVQHFTKRLSLLRPWSITMPMLGIVTEVSAMLVARMTVATPPMGSSRFCDDLCNFWIRIAPELLFLISLSTSSISARSGRKIKMLPPGPMRHKISLKWLASDTWIIATSKPTRRLTSAAALFVCMHVWYGAWYGLVWWVVWFRMV